MKAPGMKRFIRLRSLGAEYSREEIERKTRSTRHFVDEYMPPKYIKYPPDDSIGRFIGTQAYYYNITQQMRRLIDRQHLHYTPALRAEIRKLEQYDEDLRFQEKYNVTSRDELRARRDDLQCIIDEIVRRREPIYKERRTAAAKANPQRMAELDEELKKYKAALVSLRHEVRVANRIVDRLDNKLPEMLAAREAQERIKEDEEQERLTRKQSISARTKVLPLSRTILIWQGRVQDRM